MKDAINVSIKYAFVLWGYGLFAFLAVGSFTFLKKIPFSCSDRFASIEIHRVHSFRIEIVSIGVHINKITFAYNGTRKIIKRPKRPGRMLSFVHPRVCVCVSVCVLWRRTRPSVGFCTHWPFFFFCFHPGPSILLSMASNKGSFTSSSSPFVQGFNFFPPFQQLTTTTTTTKKPFAHCAALDKSCSTRPPTGCSLRLSCGQQTRVRYPGKGSKGANDI